MGDTSFDLTNKFFQENMQFAQSSTPYSWARQISHLKEAQSVSPVELSYILGVLIQGGLETTSTVLEFFTVASVLHPESVEKAQEELDTVVGKDRLPSFDDTPNLPYVNAFIKEVFRWRPVLPMGIPHSPIEDDEYLGYHIPKGATVVENQWGINLNDESFQDSHKFIPERWLQDPDQPLCAFGFGRRTCPGKHMAQNSMFIAIAQVLWAYNISHCYTNGKKVPIDSLDTTQILVAGPSPFKASFTIRSSAHKRIVEREWESTTTDLNVTMESIHFK
jgi:cytochrome P450